jgi:hypothetical protein
MEFTDIRSDAMNASDLEVDKQQLFQELLKGDEFIKQMKEEGRNILDRRLFKSEENCAVLLNTRLMISQVWKTSSTRNHFIMSLSN